MDIPHSVEIKQFSYNFDSSEINLGWFQMVENCHFNNFGSFEFECFGNFTLENVKNVQNSNVRAAQMVKMAVFEASQ